MDIEDELEIDSRDDPISSDDEQNEDIFENPDTNAEAVDEGAENDAQTENDSEHQNESTQKKAVKKRIVLNPRPKLDSQRLGGPKGIPILPQLFENKKFKGKGFEKEDLKELMSMLEHWGHRLFPIMTFDTLLAAIEKLGTKKPVQVCIKKMRMDMPILDNDFVVQRDDDDMDPSAADQEQDLIERDHDVEMNDAFDELLRTENENNQLNGLHQDNLETQNVTRTSSQPAVTITDEMRERMERNRQLALERKRMRQLEQGKLNASVEVNNTDNSRELSKSVDGMDSMLYSEGQHSSGTTSDLPSNTVISQNDSTEQKQHNSPNSQAVPSMTEKSSNPNDCDRPAELLDEDQLLEEMWGGAT